MTELPEEPGPKDAHRTWQLAAKTGERCPVCFLSPRYTYCAGCAQRGDTCQADDEAAVFLCWRCLWQQWGSTMIARKFTTFTQEK